MSPPQVLQLIERSERERFERERSERERFERERFERNLDHYKRPAYKETQVRGEHEDMPDNQDRVAAGVGGMIGLRRMVARWGLRGIVGVGRCF